MPDLWIPNGAAEAILNDQHAEEQERHHAFRQRLRNIDPRLDIFQANRDDPENEIRAGYYYVTRHNEDGTTAFWELRHPVTDGPYEPDEAVIQMFLRSDATTVGSTAADRDERRKRMAERKRLNEEAWKERKATELAENVDYTFRVQHAFPDIPWKKQ